MSNFENPTFKKLDTFSETTYMVKLAQDPKVYPRDDGSHDVVLTFCDSSKFDNHQDLWVDARVVRGQSERAKKMRKGDIVQIKGKMRYKLQEDGKIRGKIFDAVFNSFTPTAEREEIQPTAQFSE
jgi:hypothetical protein